MPGVRQGGVSDGLEAGAAAQALGVRDADRGDLRRVATQGEIGSNV